MDQHLIPTGKQTRRAIQFYEFDIKQEAELKELGKFTEKGMAAQFIQSDTKNQYSGIIRRIVHQDSYASTQQRRAVKYPLTLAILGHGAQCERCKQLFQNPNSLYKHNKKCNIGTLVYGKYKFVIHPWDRKLFCYFGCSKFETETDLKRHLWENHTNDLHYFGMSYDEMKGYDKQLPNQRIRPSLRRLKSQSNGSLSSEDVEQLFVTLPDGSRIDVYEPMIPLPVDPLLESEADEEMKSDSQSEADCTVVNGGSDSEIISSSGKSSDDSAPEKFEPHQQDSDNLPLPQPYVPGMFCNIVNGVVQRNQIDDEIYDSDPSLDVRDSMNTIPYDSIIRTLLLSESKCRMHDKLLTKNLPADGQMYQVDGWVMRVATLAYLLEDDGLARIFYDNFAKYQKFKNHPEFALLMPCKVEVWTLKDKIIVAYNVHKDGISLREVATRDIDEAWSIIVRFRDILANYLRPTGFSLGNIDIFAIYVHPMLPDSIMYVDLYAMEQGYNIQDPWFYGKFERPSLQYTFQNPFRLIMDQWALLWVLADVNCLYHNKCRNIDGTIPSIGLYHNQYLDQWADDSDHVGDVFVAFTGKHFKFESFLRFAEKAKRDTLDAYRFMDAGIQLLDKLHEHAFKEPSDSQKMLRIRKADHPGESIAHLVEQMESNPRKGDNKKIMIKEEFQ